MKKNMVLMVLSVFVLIISTGCSSKTEQKETTEKVQEQEEEISEQEKEEEEEEKADKEGEKEKEEAESTVHEAVFQDVVFEVPAGWNAKYSDMDNWSYEKEGSTISFSYTEGVSVVNGATKEMLKKAIQNYGGLSLKIDNEYDTEVNNEYAYGVDFSAAKEETNLVSGKMVAFDRYEGAIVLLAVAPGKGDGYLSDFDGIIASMKTMESGDENKVVGQNALVQRVEEELVKMYEDANISVEQTASALLKVSIQVEDVTEIDEDAFFADMGEIYNLYLKGNTEICDVSISFGDKEKAMAGYLSLIKDDGEYSSVFMCILDDEEKNAAFETAYENAEVFSSIDTVKKYLG